MAARNVLSFNANGHPNSSGPCSYCHWPHQFQDGCNQYAFDKKKRIQDRNRNEFKSFSERNKRPSRDFSKSPRRTSFRRNTSGSPRRGTQSPFRSQSRGRSYSPNNRGRSRERENRGQCFKCGSSKHWSRDCPFAGDPPSEDRGRYNSSQRDNNRAYHVKQDRSRSRSRSSSRSRFDRHMQAYLSRHANQSTGEKCTDGKNHTRSSQAPPGQESRRVTIDDKPMHKAIDRGSPHPHPTNTIGLMALDSWARSKSFDPVGCFATTQNFEVITPEHQEFNVDTTDHPSNTFSNHIDSDSEGIDNDPDVLPRDFYFFSNENHHNFPQFSTPEYTSDNYSSDVYSDPGLLWEGNHISIYPPQDSSDSASSSLVSESSSDSESSTFDPPTTATALTVTPFTNRLMDTPVAPSTSSWICNGDIPMDPRRHQVVYTAEGSITYAFTQGTLDSFSRARSADEHWFIVDSGSNRHICADERFIHRGEIMNSSITGIGDHAVKATAHGPMLGKITDVKGNLHDILSWCMFVPTSRMSLFSVIQAVLAGNTVIHEGDPKHGKHGILLRDKGQFIPFTWCPEAGLFWLPMKTVSATRPVVLHTDT